MTHLVWTTAVIVVSVALAAFSIGIAVGQAKPWDKCQRVQQPNVKGILL